MFFLSVPSFSSADRVVFVYWSGEAQGISTDLSAVQELRRLANRDLNPQASTITTVLYFDPFDTDSDGSRFPCREVYVEGQYRSDLSVRFSEEKNFGNGAFFKEALEFSSQFEGAQRMALLSGHGSSWRGFGHDEGKEAGADFLTALELKEAFLSLPEDKRVFDLIWYYTCLMNNLEYLYEHLEFSKFVLAGDASLVSDIQLDSLYTSDALTPKELAIEIAKSNFKGSLADNTNMIVTDISELEPLVLAFKPLTQIVLNMGEEGKLTSKSLADLQDQSQIFRSLISSRVEYDVDLLRFLTLLKTFDSQDASVQNILSSLLEALRKVILYAPFDDFQQLVAEIKAWITLHGPVTQDVLDQWLCDPRLGRDRQAYKGNVTAQVFNERVVGDLPLNSPRKYTNNHDATFDLIWEFRRRLHGEFKPKEYLSFFFPSDTKLSEMKLKGNEIEVVQLPFYKELEFSRLTGWGKVIEQRLPQNKVKWLKEFKGSTQDRKNQEDRRGFHDQGL
ncbi:MAG: hypothetical protein HYY62_07455 [Deltaproteobacteria bacterium]|nr:hypothetical protein [Deltaproteobacteria bacterium]